MRVIVEFDSAIEALTILNTLSSMEAAATDIVEPLVDAPCAPEPADGRYPIEDPHNVAPPEEAPKKKRGRPKKVVPDAVVTPPEADIPTTVETAPPVETKAPEADTKADIAAPDDTVKTGDQLQDYIMSLIYQHRITAEVVKEQVYPKFGVARAFDLETPERVALVKAEIDRVAKPAKPAAPTNDLDL